MTDMLDTALQDLVPSFAEEQPDWSGVVARPTSGRRRSALPWRSPSETECRCCFRASAAPRFGCRARRTAARSVLRKTCTADHQEGVRAAKRDAGTDAAVAEGARATRQLATACRCHARPRRHRQQDIRRAAFALGCPPPGRRRMLVRRVRARPDRPQATNRRRLLHRNADRSLKDQVGLRRQRYPPHPQRPQRAARHPGSHHPRVLPSRSHPHSPSRRPLLPRCVPSHGRNSRWSGRARCTGPQCCLVRSPTPLGRVRTSTIRGPPIRVPWPRMKT